MMYETTALIVGAGPTGLTLAIDLARRKISFRLIEAAAKPLEGSRGKGLQPRTLEIFDDLGVIEAILAAGSLYPKIRTHFGPFSLRAGSLHSSCRQRACLIRIVGWYRKRARRQSCASVWARSAARSNSAGRL